MHESPAAQENNYCHLADMWRRANAARSAHSTPPHRLHTDEREGGNGEGREAFEWERGFV